MRYLGLIFLTLPVAVGAIGDGETTPWVKVTPAVMEAGSVVRKITFDVKMPADAPAGATLDIELPYYFTLPQTADPLAEGFLSANIPNGVEVDLAGVNAPPRSVIIRLTVKTGVLLAGKKFKIFLENERVHPFDHAEVAFAAIIRGPVPVGATEGPVIARGQATVVRIPGGNPAKFRVVGPTCITPGEPFPLKVAALDANNNPPGVPFNGKIFFSGEGILGPGEYKMNGNYAEVGGFVAPGVGVFRVTVTANGITGESNPLVCRERWDRRIFWGDIHGHSAFSDGMRQPDEFFDYGRYVALLDVTCLTDHAECLWEDEWPLMMEVVKKKNSPPNFVTLLSYEWTSDVWEKGFGHRCVYFRGDAGEYFNSYSADADTPKELFAKYEPGEVITIPHHTLAGFRWSNCDFAFDRAVEVVSHWGSSEYEGNPDQPKFRIWRGGGVVDALNSYYVLGFVGGGDNHNGAPGQNHKPSRFPNLWYYGGLTAFLLEENSREEVFAALRDRRVYATAGNRDFIDFQVDGAPMGNFVAVAGPPRITAEVATEDVMSAVEVVRGGKTVYAAEVPAGARELKFEWKDEGYAGEPTYYYLRVRSADGHLSFASPVWVAPGTRPRDVSFPKSFAEGESCSLPVPTTSADGNWAVFVNSAPPAAGSWQVIVGKGVAAEAPVTAGTQVLPFRCSPDNWDVHLKYTGRGVVATEVAVMAFPWLEPRWVGRWWTFEAERAGKMSRGTVTDEPAASAGKALKVSPADNLYDKTVLWGPYQELEPGRYRAYFYIRAEGVVSAKPVAEVEVATAPAGAGRAPEPVVKRLVTCQMVAGSAYRPVVLEFEVTERSACEYKIKYIGNAILFIDKVDVQQFAYEG